MRLRGRHLLDHEALTCLLVLLFVDEPKLNTGRLHRVLRNLCYHAQTRAWVIRALLSILQRTGECRVEGEEKPKHTDKSKKKASLTGDSSPVSGKLAADRNTQPSWLSVSLDAALGCRANVFQIQRTGKKWSTSGGTAVSINGQASPLICRHVLDTLISLAKSFPCHFLPQTKAKEAKCDADCKDSGLPEDKHKSPKDSDSKTSLNSNSSSQTSPARASKSECKLDCGRTETDFWDLLVKLDNSTSSRKGKGVQRAHSAVSVETDSVVSTYDSSPLGQLMVMLSHPVIRRSQLLTDRLLRLLGLVSVGLPDITQPAAAPRTSNDVSGALGM